MDYIPPPVIEDQLEDVMDTRSDSKSIVEENDESNVLASLVPSLKSSEIQNDGMKEDESNVESTMDLDVKEHHDSTVFEDVVMEDLVQEFKEWAGRSGKDCGAQSMDTGLQAFKDQ